MTAVGPKPPSKGTEPDKQRPSQTTETRLMHPSKSIAVLIRHEERLPEALRTGERFCLAGMTVAIFVISVALQAGDTDGCEDLARRLARDAQCYCCRSDPARRLGFHQASLSQMADKIAGADLVISF